MFGVKPKKLYNIRENRVVLTYNCIVLNENQKRFFFLFFFFTPINKLFVLRGILYRQRQATHVYTLSKTSGIRLMARVFGMKLRNNGTCKVNINRPLLLLLL